MRILLLLQRPTTGGGVVLGLNGPSLCRQVLSERSKDKPKDLLGDTWEYIQIQLGTSKAPQQSGPKPIQLSLPHPIYSADDGFSICLIVKVRAHAARWRSVRRVG